MIDIDEIELQQFFKDSPTAKETVVGFKRLSKTAIIPTKAHPTDSGFDLYADETVIIEPNQTSVIKTGIAVALPAGHEATVRPRSGITSKTKLRVQLGTVDNAYRGDIGIIVDNVAETPRGITGELKGVNGAFAASPNNELFRIGTHIIRKGDKLAQMVISPVAMFAGVEVFDLDSTDRGENGFGSTGVTSE